MKFSLFREDRIETAFGFAGSAVCTVLADGKVVFSFGNVNCFNRTGAFAGTAHLTFIGIDFMHFLLHVNDSFIYYLYYTILTGKRREL